MDDLEKLRTALNVRVPKNFIRRYENARLDRLLRYIHALSLPSEQGLANLEKDRNKSREVEAFPDQLSQVVKSLASQSSMGKRHVVEAFL